MVVLFSLASYFESDTSPVVRIRASSGSNSSPFIYDHLRPKIVFIADYYELKRPIWALQMTNLPLGITILMYSF